MSEEENCKDKNFGSKNQHTDTNKHTHTHVQREQISSIYFCLCVDSLNKTKKKRNMFSNMAKKQINIRWIRTSSQPNLKIHVEQFLRI